MSNKEAFILTDLLVAAEYRIIIFYEFFIKVRNIGDLSKQYVNSIHD
jgi:hypothetical protein